MRISPIGYLPALALVSLMAAAPAWSSVVVTYDPGLGSLPQAQGYTYGDYDALAPAPAVAQGILKQGPTSPDGMQYWIRADHAFAFAAPFVLEADLRVVSSQYVGDVGDGTQRSGFYLEADDTTGHRITLGISSSGVTLNTDRYLFPSNGIPLVAFNTTGAFHHYAAVAQSGTIALFIDGVLRGSTSVGDSLFPGSSRCVYFGDGTNAAGSQMEIGQVRFSYQPSTAGVADASRVSTGALRIAAAGGLVPGGINLVLSAGTAAPVRIKVVDPCGRIVLDLGEAIAGPAARTLYWNRMDASGRPVPAGVYFALAANRTEHASCRMVVLR